MHCWFCLLNTRLLLSAVMTNSQQCRKWLFSITCEGKQSFSTLLAVCHHCWQYSLVFDKHSTLHVSDPEERPSPAVAGDVLIVIQIWSSEIGVLWLVIAHGPITRLESKNKNADRSALIMLNFCARTLIGSESKLLSLSSTFTRTCTMVRKSLNLAQF